MLIKAELDLDTHARSKLVAPAREVDRAVLVVESREIFAKRRRLVEFGNRDRLRNVVTGCDSEVPARVIGQSRHAERAKGHAREGDGTNFHGYPYRRPPHAGDPACANTFTTNRRG